jgi:hypothetical protein
MHRAALDVKNWQCPFRDRLRSRSQPALNTANKAGPPAAFRTARAFPRPLKEKTMNTTRLPGNEPDPADMSIPPATEAPTDDPHKHDLPDDEAEKLGNFA